MRRATQWIGALVAAGLALASPAAALNIVNVTITGDVVAAADGQTSLREAFTIANTDGDETRIVLVAAAVYRLCDGAAGTDEDANANGDLDHTAAQPLTIEGNGAEIRASCPGERVLHHVNDASTITLRNLQVNGGDLTAGGAQGSGLFTIGNAVIENTGFSDNTGAAALEIGEEGGGAFGRTLTVTDSRFTDNTVGIRLNRSTGTVTGSEARVNQGAGITVSFSTITLDDVDLIDNGGAGIAGIDGTVTVNNSRVRNNMGTGIRNTGNSDTGQPLTVTNTIVDNNRTGIDCSYCTNLTITGSTITGSRPTAGGFGGAGVRFQANRPSPAVVISDTTITNNQSAEDGAGLRARADDDVVTNVTLTNVTLSGNRTLSVFDEGGGIYGHSIALTLTGSHVDGNFAKPPGILVGGNGGGIALYEGSRITATNSTISGNFAYTGGGGLYLIDATAATFTDTTIADNQAEGSGGGGVQVVGSTPLVVRFTRSTVRGNTSRLAGGGAGVTVAGADVEIDRSTVSGNTSTTSNGGGLYMNGKGIDANLVNSTLSGNSAGGGQGGGLLKIGTGELRTRYVTAVRNSGAAVANVMLGASVWTSFATVVAEAGGGGTDCSVAFGKVVPQGYNFAGDKSCGFGGGPGDVVGGGAPMLAALASAGGPTATHVPDLKSPLIDRVPVRACQEKIDQRGVKRPAAKGCDTGSVEGGKAGRFTPKAP